MTRTEYAAVRPAATRKWLAVFALLSFFLQSLAVQTHIHPQPPLTVATAVDTGTSAPAPAKDQNPMDQCRLCQELVHAGNFVAPSSAVAVASLSFVAAIFAPLVSPKTLSATSFTWQSRAPPAH
jgi:hypothetical protein